MKNKMLTFRVEDELIQRLDEVILYQVDTRRKTRGAILREIVKNYVEQEFAKTGRQLSSVLW